MVHVLTVFSNSTAIRYNVEKFCAAVLLAAIMLPVTIVNATTVDMNSVLLTIKGNIEGKNNDIVQLNLESISKLSATTFTTNAPWTDEPTEYTGVRINTLLEAVGAASTQFEATASNDYTFTLSDIDFDKYPIIIAYKVNGAYPSARKVGPLLIVFPFDDYPELLTEKNKAASVWQLIEMRVL